MERRFIGLRPTGPDTEVATNSYKKSSGNVERIRAELFSCKKAKALETRNRFCTTCPYLATQIALYDYDGATTMERYCQECIDISKHLRTSEIMANFDNLFIRKEPE
jgi:hypothetical protein